MGATFGAQLGQQLATQAASQGLGALMGLAMEPHVDRRQIRQQQKLTDMQVAADKNLSDYNYAKQLEMWKATNYGPQMEELEKAGLNPGLIYGMSGGGGTTTGSGPGQSAGSGEAPKGGGEILGLMGQNSQMAMTMAQIELVKSQTKLNEVEANKKAGVDTELVKTNIESLTQGITNQKLQAELTKVQTMVANLDKDYLKETMENRVDQWNYIINLAQSQLGISVNEGTILEETRQQKIDIVKEELAGIILRNELTKSQTKLTDEQQKAVIQSIKTQITELQQKGRALDQKDQDILIDKARNELIEKGIWVGAASNIANSVVNILTKKAGGR